MIYRIPKTNSKVGIKMKNIIKIIFLSCLTVIIAASVSACNSGASPYEGYDGDGYTVSVKFDANGGVFTSNTEVRVDTYDLSQYKTNSNGKKEIKLFDPNDPIRGDQQYAAYLDEDHYLAGWYTERTENEDADGNVTYSYSGWWDFENDLLELDPSGQYSAGEAVITLYAAWVPHFTYEFYEVMPDGSVSMIGTPISTEPGSGASIKLPSTDTVTGQLGYANDFPKLDGKTYDKIFADRELMQEITSETLTHSGSFERETAAVKNNVMKIYCTTLDGLWFEVDSAKKITDNAFLNANFILKSDIDFEGKYWPETFKSSNFTGSITGNGYTVKNISITQSNSDSMNFGLFGQLTDSSSLKDVTFDNVKVVVTDGLRNTASNIGILAGSISDGADISGVILKNSTLQITVNTMKPFVTYPVYGIVSGYGELDGIDWTENNNVTFDGECIYDYSVDEEGRFTLSQKAS